MSERISVLIIDDEEYLLEMLKDNLNIDGFEVHQTANGREGIDIARRIKPDVILLDRIMPEMDGMQVLSELKRDEQTKHIPVFMLTAKTAPSDISQAICEGAEGYFAKPFEVLKLGRTIRHKLEELAKT